MRPSSNLKTLSAESHVAQDDNWMLSYIDVFVLITTLFLMLLVLNENRFGALPQATEPQDSISLKNTPTNPASHQVEIVPEPQKQQISDLYLSLSKAIEQHQMGSHIELVQEPDKTRLEIESRVLFNSGDAYLTRSGDALLEKLLPILDATDNSLIVIEGHTDNEPIQTRQFPSNWSLAAARATEVLSFFVAEGFEETRFRAVSYGDTQPVAPNDSPANKQKNRRVSLVIEQALH